jgi:hypothetical protein
MITWIIVGYLAASSVASLLVYTACVAAARADRIQQNAFANRLEHDQKVDGKCTDPMATSRLLLNA